MEWIPVIVAILALIGIAINNAIIARNNQRIERRWHADQRALESRWRTELAALDARTDRVIDDTARRDRREQAVEIYKWAAELAVSENPRQAQTGVDALNALLGGDLLDLDLKLLVEASLSSSFASPLAAIQRALDAGEEVVVYQVDLSADVADVGSSEEAPLDEANVLKEGEDA